MAELSKASKTRASSETVFIVLCFQSWLNRTTSMTKMRSKSRYDCFSKVFYSFYSAHLYCLYSIPLFRQSSRNNNRTKRHENHSNSRGVGLWDQSQGQWSGCGKNHLGCWFAFRYSMIVEPKFWTFSGVTRALLKIAEFVEADLNDGLTGRTTKV